MAVIHARDKEGCLAAPSLPGWRWETSANRKELIGKGKNIRGKNMIPGFIFLPRMFLPPSTRRGLKVFLTHQGSLWLTNVHISEFTSIVVVVVLGIIQCFSDRDQD